MDDDKLKALWEEVKTQRDELRVQIHLARAELKDEFEELEKKWDDNQEKIDAFMDEASEAAGHARDALKVIGEELGDAYSRIRKRLDD